jgi:hypothetical protein
MRDNLGTSRRDPRQHEKQGERKRCPDDETEHSIFLIVMGLANPAAEFGDALDGRKLKAGHPPVPAFLLRDTTSEQD